MNKQTTEKINVYIADTAVLFIKWHNLHWNVVGSQFKSVHEYLETLYDSLSDVLDETAEILKMHDELPLASLSDYLKVTNVKELESKDIQINDALDIVIKDMELMRTNATEIRVLADNENLFDVVSMMEDHISEYNKNLWFIKATRK